MSDKVQLGSVTGALSASLGETFEGVKGFYLDPDESLLKTLEAVSAATASKPISQRGTSIAAHVAHARFYLVEIVHASQAGPREVDWDESWKPVAVDEAQWKALKAELRDVYGQVSGIMKGMPAQVAEQHLAGAIAAIAHSAYHLGAIRQILNVVA